MKAERKAASTGVGPGKNVAAIAMEKPDGVIAGDVEALELSGHFRPSYSDGIVLGDILEHLADPWGILGRSVQFLADEGVVVAGIPDIGYYTDLLDLASRRYWASGTGECMIEPIYASCT